MVTRTGFEPMGVCCIIEFASVKRQVGQILHLEEITQKGTLEVEGRVKRHKHPQ